MRVPLLFDTRCLSICHYTPFRIPVSSKLTRQDTSITHIDFFPSRIYNQHHVSPYPFPLPKTPDQSAPGRCHIDEKCTDPARPPLSAAAAAVAAAATTTQLTRVIQCWWSEGGRARGSSIRALPAWQYRSMGMASRQERSTDRLGLPFPVSASAALSCLARFSFVCHACLVPLFRGGVMVVSSGSFRFKI